MKDGMLRLEDDGLASMFEEACALAPESRTVFLENACGGDRALRDEILSLLSVQDAAATYFDGLGERVIAPALLAMADETDNDLTSGDEVAHYRIQERIGSGGMGIVYAALDVHLGRPVALKFLPQHLGPNPHAKERFLAEARAASRLDHPNIGIVHEIGETVDGRFFIAMALYEGETLDRRIARGPLPLDDVVTLARQIAAALAAAHDKGVVHRDVKPSNIMITAQGVVKLLDFGIAQVADAEPGPERTIPGTVGYMSPEQTRGDSVDHRTDIWSLGIVLYEMLSGTRPFRGTDRRSVVEAIQLAPWAVGSRAQLHASRTLQGVIRRCLEKDPAQRYGRAEEILIDLGKHEEDRSRSIGGRHRRRIAVATAAGTLLLSALYWQSVGPPSDPGTPPPSTRMAVLPLTGVDLPAEDSHLAEALTRELTRELSHTGRLSVIAPGSVIRSPDAASSAELGRTLDVATILEGTVQTSGDEVALTLHLTDVTTEERLWTATFMSPLADMIATQVDVARRVADTLDTGGAAGDAITASRAGTVSSDAYSLYLKGQYHLAKRDEASVRRARDYFQQALDIDPTFARAWAGWADALDVMAWLSIVPPHDAYPQSRAAAILALQHDPGLADAHVSLAKALYRYEFQFESAAAHLREAIRLNPSHAEARQLYAAYLRMRERFDQSAYEGEMAARLDPLAPMNQVEIGITLYMARRYDQALARYRRVLESRPDFAPVHFFIALIHLQQAEYDQALAVLDRAQPAVRWHDAAALRALIEARRGRAAEARRRLAELERLAATEYVSPWYPALIHVGLEEYDRALDLFERAFEERAWQIPLLAVEPTFDPLRSDPRFLALVEKLRR